MLAFGRVSNRLIYRTTEPVRSTGIWLLHPSAQRRRVSAMSKINSDFSKKVIVHSDELEWKPSPLPGVDRRMLDRIGDEVARATSIVRYSPGSSFSRHTHGGGEEYFVLDGIFQDDAGDHPEGEYVRNPPTSAHTPYTNPGCTIFVKLWQMKAEDRNQVNISMDVAVSKSETGRSTLFKDDEEHVYVQQLSAEQGLEVDATGGAEVFVLKGTVHDSDGGEVLREQSWMRVPPGATVNAAAGSSGARVWVKEGHLLSPRGLILPSK